jgi:L-rhamnono-1,4-lactonase
VTSADRGKDHLCKPNMEQTQAIAKQKDDFYCWKSCIQRLSSFENVYMKLSGAFAELEVQSPAEPWPVDTIVERIMPWVQHVLDCFTPERVMFGGDWPVCNVRGPGDKLSWGLWRDVVDQVLKTAGLSGEDMDKIWRRTAIAAYSLDDRGQG